jgi:hypothetical protein
LEQIRGTWQLSGLGDEICCRVALKKSHACSNSSQRMGFNMTQRAVQHSELWHGFNGFWHSFWHCPSQGLLNFFLCTQVTSQHRRVTSMHRIATSGLVWSFPVHPPWKSWNSHIFIWDIDIWSGYCCIWCYIV